MATNETEHVSVDIPNIEESGRIFHVLRFATSALDRATICRQSNDTSLTQQTGTDFAPDPLNRQLVL